MVLNDESEAAKLRQDWPSFNKDQLMVFQTMYTYLKQFSLEKLIIHSNYDCSSMINSNTVMRLPPMTLNNLELNDVSRGSLMSLLNIGEKNN